MGYIGNQTSNAFTSITKQDLTGVTGSPVKRGFTLDHAVANANEIEVFVNNVRQEPTEAYTVSGTGLTMTGDVETTDDFYVVFQGKALQTTVPPDDSVTTARINDGAVTSAKLDTNITVGGTLTATTGLKLGSGTDTLSTFDEGTFTPTIFGSTTAGVFSYNTSNTYGHYQRINNVVFFTARVYVDTITTDSAGNSRLGSLPFTASEASAISVGKLDHAGSGWSGYGMFAQVEASADYIQFYFYDNPNQFSVATGLWADESPSDIIEVLVSGHYRTS